jgi:uncharacterized protein involved in oxidation of intracellular sulfur
MKILLILNDPPYGTELVYNGLRLAMNLQKNHEQVELSVFLMGDAASAAKSGQQTPNGYYNIERMLKTLVHSPRPTWSRAPRAAPWTSSVS